MKTMQVSVRKSDHVPGGNGLLPLAIEQQYPATFERDPNLLRGGMTVRRIGRSGLRLKVRHQRLHHEHQRPSPI